MSRFGEEPVDSLDADVRPNAECHDCGLPYARAEFDRTVWCDACSDRRDRWATAQEVRTMLKAVLDVDLSTVRDVA